MVKVGLPNVGHGITLALVRQVEQLVRMLGLAAEAELLLLILHGLGGPEICFGTKLILLRSCCLGG